MFVLVILLHQTRRHGDLYFNIKHVFILTFTNDNPVYFILSSEINVYKNG